MLLFLLACAADGDTGGTVNGPQDLSGYATAADLAALQEQLDEQAEEIGELQAMVAAASVQVVTATCADEGYTEPTASFIFTAHVNVLQVEVCQAAENGTRCVGPDPTGIGLYSSYSYDTSVDGASAAVRIYCDAIGDTAQVSYILTD